MRKNIHSRLEEIIAVAEPGERLLSEPKLAEQLGVSRATLREAMRTFETQGLLRRRQGVGTFVVRPTRVIESGLEVLESIETLADRIGLPVTMGELQISKCRLDNATAKLMQLSLDTEGICVSRVILAEGRPVAYLVDTLPSGYLSSEEMANEFTGSVLDLMLKRGTPLLESARSEIKAVAANPDVSRALDIRRGDSVLLFESILFTLEGLPIDYSLSYFLPGYFKFHVVRRVG